MPVRFQSAIDSAGIQAARIETLWWIMFWVCTVVFVAVMTALIVAIRRGRSEGPRPTEPAMVRGVTIALASSVVALIGLLFASVITGRAIGSLSSDQPLAIQVTGHQWWWEIEYLNDPPSLRVTTANELHLPVGRPVAITLKSSDVIHSFWVPNLHGKMDLVPGRVNTIWLRVDKPDVFRGQCAEYCGVQHAHMALAVIGESSDDFEQWLTAQRTIARPPASEAESRGLDVIERGPCAMCHTIKGTTAGARLGPDLTHFATRSTIAAGTAPNTPGYLGGWISDPQHLKPGNRMPPTGLSSGDLQAVIAYLQTLR